jgi:hypothetical protein
MPGLFFIRKRDEKRNRDSLGYLDMKHHPGTAETLPNQVLQRAITLPRFARSVARR